MFTHDNYRLENYVLIQFNWGQGPQLLCFIQDNIWGSLTWEALLKTFRHQVGFYNSFFNVIKDVFWVGTLVFLWHHHDSRDKWIVCRPPISSIKCQSEPMKIFLFWFRNVSFFRNNCECLGHLAAMTLVALMTDEPWRPLVLTWWPRVVVRANIILLIFLDLTMKVTSYRCYDRWAVGDHWS